MTQDTEKERAEFEAWARDRYPSINLTREGDDYRMALAKDYWSLWQAARRAPVVPVDWRLIESAPKHDGAVIWAYSDGEQARMRWCLTPDGDLWIWDDEILSDAEPDPIQPTHWMPLPVGPLAAAH